MIIKGIKNTLITLILLLATNVVEAGIQKKELSEQIEHSRLIKQGQAKQIVVEQLPLTEQQSQIFWPIYENYKTEMESLNSRLLKIITQYAKHYNANDLDEKKGLQLLEKSFAIEVDRINIKRKYVKIFKKQLPAKIVARFFQIDNKIEALIKYGLSKEVPLIPTR